jgi:hypothetical protein
VGILPSNIPFVDLLSWNWGSFQTLNIIYASSFVGFAAYRDCKLESGWVDGFGRDDRYPNENESARSRIRDEVTKLYFGLNNIPIYAIFGRILSSMF